MRMRVVLALAAAGLATAAYKEPTMHHATGTFAVKITPEAQAPAPAGGLPTGRMGIAKTFSGGLTGTATGTMISAGAPTPGNAGAYVAVDQFTGTVDGRRGGFLLLHRGTMDKAGKGDLVIVISPDTGTDALTGIAGTLSIEIKDGVHHYDLAYTLPE
ncbi:DUF3224 domain-containing protein [uncultured Sphingomonas sp.]|uniref:DUF3224 domain-containing protein n=1 Tax=uncultured Sphingomonas sp. TaxID=158754 RepID=UPI0035CB692C